MKVLSQDKITILEFVDAEICKYSQNCTIKVSGLDVASYESLKEAEVAFDELINKYIANEKLHRMK